MYRKLLTVASAILMLCSLWITLRTVQIMQQKRDAAWAPGASSTMSADDTSTSPLIWWLLRWNRHQQVHQLDGLTSIVLGLRTNAAARNTWRAKTVVLKEQFPGLVAFGDWLDNPANRTVLSALCNSVQVETWPLYAYAMDMTPANDSRPYIVPAARLSEIGFAADRLWDGSLVWFEHFYMKHLGTDAALSFWDWIRTNRPELAHVCAIRQAHIEYTAGNHSAAVVRINQNSAALFATEWTSNQACELLIKMQVPMLHDAYACVADNKCPGQQDAGEKLSSTNHVPHIRPQ